MGLVANMYRRATGLTGPITEHRSIKEIKVGDKILLEENDVAWTCKSIKEDTSGYGCCFENEAGDGRWVFDSILNVIIA